MGSWMICDYKGAKRLILVKKKKEKKEKMQPLTTRCNWFNPMKNDVHAKTNTNLYTKRHAYTQ